MSGIRQRRARGPIIAVVAAGAFLALMLARPFGPIPLLLLGGVIALVLVFGVSGGGNPDARIADSRASRGAAAPHPAARPAPAPSGRERWEARP